MCITPQRFYFALHRLLARPDEDQRRFQGVVDALAPAVSSFRGTADGTIALGMLLPHLGFAYQELGQFDKAIQVFEDAFAPWQQGRRIGVHPYPFAQQVGPVWLIGVNAATGNRLPWNATGAVLGVRCLARCSQRPLGVRCDAARLA